MSTKKLSAALAVTAVIGLGALALAGPAQASTGGQQKHTPTALRFTGVASGKVAPSTGAMTPAAAKLAGYTIANSGPVTSPANGQVRGTAVCPSGKVPLGGGFFSSSGSVGANENSSFPVTGGWSVDFNNSTATASTFTVYAVCAKAPKKYAVVVGSGTTVNAGTQLGNITASCPAGAKALGGGSFSSSGSVLATVNSSIPTTTGWRVDANNGSATAEAVTAYVVCGKVAKYRVVTGPVTGNNPGVQTASSAACGGTGVPTGGGAFSNSGSTLVAINSSFPTTGGWGSDMNNGSATAASVTTYAVCTG